VATEAGSPRRILVTGAAGFAGRHLLQYLTGKGPLTAWSRPGGTLPPEKADGVTWSNVDLVDRSAVETAVRTAAPQRIAHLAGAANVATSFRTAVPHLAANALGTHHLIESVRTAAPGCRLLVVTSAQVYGTSREPLTERSALQPTSPYGFTKLAQDQLALAAAADGLDIMVARPFNHVGPGQQPDYAIAAFARQIAMAEAGLLPPVLRVGNLDSWRDITDVRDVVEAYSRLLEHGRAGRAYNVCSGRVCRIGDLLDQLCAMSAVPITVEVDPERFRPVDVPVIEGDASVIREDVGWTPKIPIEQTLADTLDDWRRIVGNDPIR
jgi:GDP-4-dehydro-6-deoxy-D-mannose reductase